MMMKDIETLVKDAYADGVDMETLLSKVRENQSQVSLT